MTGTPLFHGGSFNCILPSLIQMVCNQVGITNLSVDKKKAFVGDTAINVFSHLKIMLLPWSNTQSSSNSAYSIVNSPLPVNPPHVHSMVIGILQSFLLVESLNNCYATHFATFVHCNGILELCHKCPSSGYCVTFVTYY